MNVPTRLAVRDDDGAFLSRAAVGPRELRVCLALIAISAPSPVSYFRLGPHHWSAGFRAIGLQNREATLRVTPGVGEAPLLARLIVYVRFWVWFTGSGWAVRVTKRLGLVFEIWEVSLVAWLVAVAVR